MRLRAPQRPLSLFVVLLWLTLALAPLTWAGDETGWLAIAASDATLSTALGKLQSLGGKESGLDLVSSSDCKNLRPDIFLITAGMRRSKDGAKAEVKRWRTKGTKDAYARVCQIVPDSRLALNTPVLDSSILRRPVDTVNWTYEDALSRTNTLSSSLVAVIRSRYESVAEDVREGLRTSLSVIIKPGGESVTLQEDCIDPEPTAHGNLVAVSCVNATAADQLLHITRVYKIPSGKVILERERCRSPQLLANRLSCQEEELDQQGNLRLVARTYALPTE
jgi:hypothetical protein